MATETLQVILSAHAAAFSRGMESAGKSVEQAGKKMSEFGGKLAGVSAALTGFGGLMVREAAKYDSNVSRAVKDMQGAYAGLSVEVGRALIPAVQKLTKFIDGLTDAWRSLDPETRNTIANVATATAGVAAFVGVGLKLVGLGAQIVGTLASIAVGFGPIALGAMAATAGVLSLLGALKKQEDYANRKSSAESAGGKYEDAVAQLKRVSQEIENAQANIAYYQGKGLADQAEEERRALLMLQKEKAAIERAIPGMSGKATSAASSLFEGLPSDFAGYLKSAMAGVGEMFGESAAGKFLEKLMGGGKGYRPSPLGKGGQGGLPGSGSKLSDDDLTLEERNAEEEEYRRRKSILESSSDLWDAVLSEEKRLATMAASTLTDIGSTVDAFRDRFKTLVAGIAGNATSQLGGRASAVMQGAQQGSAAGPWGAIIGAVAALLMQTQGFAKLIQQIEEGLGFVIEALEPLLAPMVVIGQLANDLIGAFGPLMDAFSLIGSAALFLTKGILEINELLLTGMRDIANALGLTGVAEYINVNLLTPVSKAAMSAQTAMDKLSKSSTKAADTQERVADSTTKSMQSWAESITNSPVGYRVAAARYGAADVGGTSGGMLPGGAGPTIEVTINGDLAGLVTQVEVSQKKKSFRRTGSNYANSGKPVRGGDDS